MPAVYIDTMVQFRAVRSRMRPVYITSKTRGRVLVPCANTLLVRPALILANTYNPNSVSGDKLELLCTSIVDNGFCFPVVAIWDDDLGAFVVIDGFHRKLVSGDGWLDFDYVPLVVLEHSIAQRMTATMQFNKARGVHQVDLDAEVIRALAEQGMSDEGIAEKLGVELDTVHRYKQVTGIAELFKSADYSMAWTMVDDGA